MRKAIITPFNAFSLFSFGLLVVMYFLARDTSLNKDLLACVSAAAGFTLIGSFLIWTLFEED